MMLIVENFLTVNVFLQSIRLIFNRNFSLSLYEFALHCYLAQYVTFFMPL